MKAMAKLILMLVVLGLISTRVHATSVWTNSAGNGLWNTAVNWSNGVPSTSGGDTAVFDGGTTGRTITLASPQPKNIAIVFRSGAGSYTFAAGTSGYVDNQAASGSINTDAGMTNDQMFAWVKIGNTQTWNLNGSGDVTISPTLEHANTWGDTYVQTLTLNVNDPGAVLTFGSFAQDRRLTTIKNGPGRLVLKGVVDWPYGTNGAAFVSSSFVTTNGSLDISAATLKLEDHAAGRALKTGQSYLVVNYTNATLVGNASFTSISNLPSGWQVLNLPAQYKIVLREIPPLPKTTVTFVW